MTALFSFMLVESLPGILLFLKWKWDMTVESLENIYNWNISMHSNVNRSFTESRNWHMIAQEHFLKNFDSTAEYKALRKELIELPENVYIS